VTVAAVPDHPAERALFEGVLTCDTVLPARFEAGDRPLLQAQSQALLQGLAVAEDVRGDDPENRKETTPAQQRIEAKLDLALSLLGRLARQHEGPLPIVRLRWSHRGLRLDLAAAAAVAEDEPGIVTLQPAEWLGDRIELPVRVLAQAQGTGGAHHLWLSLDSLMPGLAEAMERHLFRLHRKQIAEARQAHRPP